MKSDLESTITIGLISAYKILFRGQATKRGPPPPPTSLCSLPSSPHSYIFHRSTPTRIHLSILLVSVSFYEYLDKSARLFGDAEMAGMFREAYAGIEEHLTWGGAGWRRPGLHVEVDMWSGRQGGYRVSSLQAFWPAVQAGAGDVRAAERTYGALFDLWEEYEALPDFYDAFNNRFVCTHNTHHVCLCVFGDGVGGGCWRGELSGHIEDAFVKGGPRATREAAGRKTKHLFVFGEVYGDRNAGGRQAKMVSPPYSPRPPQKKINNNNIYKQRFGG